MITRIREVRRARNLTLHEVAQRCDPPTTAQTIGRLETGTRTVSVGWLNRIAAALGVEAGDLVRMTDQAELPIAALLDADGARAPARDQMATAPRPEPELIVLAVAGSIGDYRRGDEIWLKRVPAPDFSPALNKDVLLPRPGGRFLFGRLIGRDEERLHLLPLGTNERQMVISDPGWIGVAMRLIRSL